MANPGMRPEPHDEYPHPAGAERNFNESVYVNAFDTRLGMGGWMRMGNRVNEGYAELSACFYLPDGKVACQFQRPEIASNEAFDAGGLHYEVIEPFRRIAVRFDGELLLLDDPGVLRDPARAFATAARALARIRWDVRAVSPAHGGEPTSPEGEERMLYGHDFARGHFNQHTGTTGSIEIGDARWDIDGYGWRDHSWGPVTGRRSGPTVCSSPPAARTAVS